MSAKRNNTPRSPHGQLQTMRNLINVYHTHSKVLSHKEAYKLALTTLQIFEDEWNKYLDEEARDLSIFEEEDE